MDNKELAVKATKNIMVAMTVKWAVIFGLNAIWRRQVKKALTKNPPQDES